MASKCKIICRYTTVLNKVYEHYNRSLWNSGHKRMFLSAVNCFVHKSMNNKPMNAFFFLFSFCSQYFRETILNEIRKARDLYSGVELAAELNRIQQRLDNVECLSVDVVINLLLTYRDIQVWTDAPHPLRLAALSVFLQQKKGFSHNEKEQTQPCRTTFWLEQNIRLGFYLLRRVVHDHKLFGGHRSEVWQSD